MVLVKCRSAPYEAGSTKSYKLETRKLYHIDTLQDGTLFNGVASP